MRKIVFRFLFYFKDDQVELCIIQFLYILYLNFGQKIILTVFLCIHRHGCCFFSTEQYVCAQN